MIQQKSIIKTYTFWYVLIGVLMILTLFLPFRINVVEAGYSVSFFGHSSYRSGSRKVISGFKLLVPFIPIGIYIVTTLFISFSRGKVGKVFALVFSFFLILSLLVLLVATNFTLNFGGNMEALTGVGFYLMALLTMIFVVIVCVNVAKKWNNKSNQIKLNEYLLDN